MSAIAKSHARSNRELVASFERYLVARGNAAETRRAYLDAVNRLVSAIGATSVVGLDRSELRILLGEWHKKGLCANSIRAKTNGLRSFFKFVCLAGLTTHDPTLLLGQRKIPTRVPVVLTVAEVERLIAAGRDPFERAVIEVLYSTGVRVSELVNLRLEDINWAARSIRVKKGKGSKDRVVLFGSYAAKAIREYQEWRPSVGGYLFEAPSRQGTIFKRGRKWQARFYVNRVQSTISLGPISTRRQARKAFERLVTKIPGYQPVSARPYGYRAIEGVCYRLAHRANLGHVHPHALRRAMASHMLQRGANLRAIQDLLGHERLSTTMRYTWLDASDIRKVHGKCHPHEAGKS